MAFPSTMTIANTPLPGSLARATERFEAGWAKAAGMLVLGSQRLFSSSGKKPVPATVQAAQALPARASAVPVSSEVDLEARGLVEAAARGDRGAAEQLLRSLLPRVRNLVRYFVRGDAEVDDLAQESLV